VLPEKKRDVADKQRDADERFEEFKMRHPYMGHEELSLHHKHYEVEPFFETKAHKEAWKLKKKEEKMIRDERRRVLKHEREIREIEAAYAKMAYSDYSGDSDVEHVVEDGRHHRFGHERVYHDEHRYESERSASEDK